MIPWRNLRRFISKAAKQPGYAWKVFIKRLEAQAYRAFANGRSALPESVTLFLTHRCNLHCLMCGQWGEAGATRNQGEEYIRRELTFDELKKLVDDVSLFKPSITLFGGEPLLYYSCLEIIEYIKQKKLHCLMITNGSLLEEKAKELVYSGLDELNVSLDGSAELHDKIRGTPGLFDKIMRGLEQVNLYKRETGSDKPFINLQCTINKQNYMYLDQMPIVAAQAKANSLTFHNLIFIDRKILERQKEYDKLLDCDSAAWEGFVMDSGIDPKMLYEKMRNILYVKYPFSVDMYPNFSCSELNDYYGNPCYAPSGGKARCLSPWLVAYVFPDGGVRPCLNSNYSYGDIRQKGFNQAWNSEAAKKYRLLLKEKVFFLFAPGAPNSTGTRMDKENNLKKYFVLIAASFAVLTYIHDLAKEFVFSDFDDVGHYYECSRLLREGFNPWAQNDPKMIERAGQIFKEMGTQKNQFYTPLHSAGFMFLFMPFTYLPYRAAAAAWILFTNIAFFMGIVLLIRYFNKAPPWKAWGAFFLVFNMWPLREEMHFGQPNILLFFLLAGSLFFIKRKQDIAAGICLALAVTIKESFFAIFLFLLWRRNWRAVISAVGCLAALKVLTILIFGWDKELVYIHCQYVSWVTGFLRGTMSISFSEVIRRIAGHYLSESMVRVIMLCINLAIFITLLRWLKRVGRGSDNRTIALEFSLFTVFAFLVSPWLRETHLVVMALPILVAWFCFDETAGKKQLVLFAVAYFLLALKYSVLSFSQFYSGPLAIFCGAKALACLVLFYLIADILEKRPFHATE